jgi:hypothetical protein
MRQRFNLGLVWFPDTGASQPMYNDYCTALEVGKPKRNPLAVASRYLGSSTLKRKAVELQLRRRHGDPRGSVVALVANTSTTAQDQSELSSRFESQTCILQLLAARAEIGTHPSRAPVVSDTLREWSTN